MSFALTQHEHPYLSKNLWTRVIVMFVCALSMVGALLIILSFACCKDLRSRGRQILVNISVMDFGVAVFNLSGAAFYFDRFYHPQACNNCTTYPSNFFMPGGQCSESNYYPLNSTIMCPDSAIIQYLCLLQAALSLYFTYGSILWTNALCLYLYFRIVHGSMQVSRYSLYASYFFCYAMPLLLTLWLAFTGRLGYSPYESSGWCSIVLMHPATMERDIYASIFGYNLWIILTFVFVPVLSCAVHMNVKHKVKTTAMYRRSDKFLLALLSIDYKFLLIPLAFVFLRFWSFLGDVLHLYAGMKTLNTGFSFTLVILGGIGDSGQGVTNSLIFLLFTKKFRDSVKRLFCKFARGGQNLNIQNHTYQQEKEGESKSLLDSTSIENISPHNFTYQSYENTTPVPLEVDNR